MQPASASRPVRASAAVIGRDMVTVIGMLAPREEALGMSTDAPAAPVKGRWPAGDRVLLVLVIVFGAVLVGALSLVAVFWFAVQSAAAARLDGMVPAGDLIPGDCVVAFDKTGDAAAEYQLVDCDAPHAAELVYVAELADEFDTYLGARAISELAGSICDDAMRYQLYLNWGEQQRTDYPSARLHGVYQTRASWEQGETGFQCFLLNLNGDPLVGQYYKQESYLQ
jgi:hypothetical protein